MMLKMCPASRSFEEPNFLDKVLQQFHLKVLSSGVNRSKVKAEHYHLNVENVTESKSVSIHGKEML